MFACFDPTTILPDLKVDQKQKQGGTTTAGPKAKAARFKACVKSVKITVEDIRTVCNTQKLITPMHDKGKRRAVQGFLSRKPQNCHSCFVVNKAKYSIPHQ